MTVPAKTPASSGADVALYDENFAKVLTELAKLASERKKQRTPDGLRKSREIGDGKSATYVDRNAYQEWLDREFAGWSIVEHQAWETIASNTVANSETKLSSTQTYPMLFNSRIILQVTEKTGTVRRAPGIGSCGVSAKELAKNNSQLFEFKHAIAMTDAIKSACNWLGAFFDLRGDQDAIEDLYTVPTEEQVNEFYDLIKDSPEKTQEVLKLRWSGMTKKLATEFIANIKERKQKAKGDS